MVFGTEAVGQPSTGAGVSHEGEARMEEVIPLGMLADLTGHRADEGEVVGALGDLWEEISHLEARLSVALGFPRAAHDLAVVVEDGALNRHGHRLAVQSRQRGFGVEGVDVRDAPGHVAEDDVLSLGLRLGGRCTRPKRWRRE